MKNIFFEMQNVFGRKKLLLFVVLLVWAYIIKFLFFTSITLHDDEAYYWWWGQNLLLSYPDHPPGIAFFNWTAVKLFGAVDVAPRMLANVTYALLGVLCFFWGLAQWYFVKQSTTNRKMEVHDLNSFASLKRYYFRLALILPFIFVFVPHYYALSLIRSDTTMIFFATIAILCVHLQLFYISPLFSQLKNGMLLPYATFVKVFSVVLWLVAGVCWGLALTSKITAFFLLLGYAIFFFVSPMGRRALMQKLFWLHAVVATAIFMVYVVADARLQFVSLRMLFFRVQGGFSWEDFFAFHAEQPVLFFPTWYLLLLLVFFMGCTYYALAGGQNIISWFKKIKNYEETVSKPVNKKTFLFFHWIESNFLQRNYEKLYFFLIAFPSMVYFIVKPFSQNQHANWTVFAPLGLVILLAMIIAEFWRKKLWRHSFIVSVVLVSLMYGFLLLAAKTPIVTTPANPLCLYKKYEAINIDDKGNKTSGMSPKSRFAMYAQKEMDSNLLLATPDYRLASIVNLYAPLFKEVVALSLAEEYSMPPTKHAPVFYYSLWSIIKKPSDIKGQLYFLAETKLRDGKGGVVELEEKIGKSFASFSYLKTFTSYCYNKPAAQFHLYKVQGYLLGDYFLER